MPSSMHPYVVVPILACTISAATAITVWTRDPGNRRVWPIAAVSALASVWAFCEIAWNLGADASQRARLDAHLGARLGADRTSRLPRVDGCTRPRYEAGARRDPRRLRRFRLAVDRGAHEPADDRRGAAHLVGLVPRARPRDGGAVRRHRRKRGRRPPARLDPRVAVARGAAARDRGARRDRGAARGRLRHRRDPADLRRVRRAAPRHALAGADRLRARVELRALRGLDPRARGPHRARAAHAPRRHGLAHAQRPRARGERTAGGVAGHHAGRASPAERFGTHLSLDVLEPASRGARPRMPPAARARRRHGRLALDLAPVRQPRGARGAWSSSRATCAS